MTSVEVSSTVKAPVSNETENEAPSLLSLIKRRQSQEEPKQTGSALLRRKSTFKGISTSLMTALSLRRLTRSSIRKEELPTPVVPMENTYRMEPKDKRVFNPYFLEAPVNEILDHVLKDRKYDPKTCNQIACRLSQMVNSKVKEFKFNRYKFVSNVILGQTKDQDFQMASRCIWDDKKDGHTTVTYKNSSLFAVVTIHGVYFE